MLNLKNSPRLKNADATACRRANNGSIDAMPLAALKGTAQKEHVIKA